MTFVDEQPERQPAPQQQQYQQHQHQHQHQHQQQQQQQQYQQQPQHYYDQRSSTASPTTTTAANNNRTSGVVGGSPRAYPAPVSQYHQNDSYTFLSPSTSPSQHLLASTDSSPRSDHGTDIDPFLKAVGPGAGAGTGGFGTGDGSEHVAINLGAISQSPPAYHPGHSANTRSSGYMNNNNGFNNNFNNNSGGSNNTNNNSTTFDVDERRCRICLEGEDDDSFKSQHRDSSDHNHNHSHSHYREEDYGDNEDSEKGRLISPCLCKGSSRYIHLGCLEKWRVMSPRKESFYRCDTCHYEYSFRRPWAASILGNKWFLRFLTVFLVFLIAYGFAWIGRVVDTKGLWAWKVQFRPDASFPLNTVMGLDWMDVVWGCLLMSAVGWLVMSVGFFVGMAVSLSLCCCCNNDEEGEENTGGGCFGQAGGCGYCGCYCGDCGGGSGGGGGEFIIIFILLGIILVGLFLVFGGVYKLISTINKRALKTMKETILEVK